jgi:hypothetical protein
LLLLRTQISQCEGGGRRRKGMEGGGRRRKEEERSCDVGVVGVVVDVIVFKEV